MAKSAKRGLRIDSYKTNEKVVLCLTDSYHMVDSCFNIDSNFFEMTNVDVKIKLVQSEGIFTEVEQLLLPSV